MDYYLVDGKIQIPSKEKANEGYKNEMRLMVIDAISDANKKGKNYAKFADLDFWLTSELQNAGYEIIVHKVEPTFGEQCKYKVSWE